MNTTPDLLSDAGDLAAWVARGWDLHASQPDAVAAALRARAGTLGPDAADAIGLAEHVWLSHRTDPDGLRDFLDALPPALAQGGDTAPAVGRARWVLGLLGGAPAPRPGDALRCRGAQNLWAVWAARGRSAEALAMLQDERRAAQEHADPAVRRALAATCNNLAVDLRCGPRGDLATDTLMMALAEGSRELWASVGTWVQVERADYQLARCHAARGDGAAALRHAHAVRAALEAHADDAQADAFEWFFAHEALAWAQRAAGDASGAAAARSRMARCLHEVADEGLRAWCQEAIDALDAVPATAAG